MIIFLLFFIYLCQGCAYNCSSTPTVTRGLCDLGVCSCLPGWGGQYCRWPCIPLAENTLVSNATINTSDWAYYELNITKSGLLVINIAAINPGIGLFPLLFVSNGAPGRNLYPTMYSYLHCNISLTASNKTLNIDQPDQSLRWIVGVSASPIRGGNGISAYYQISWKIIDRCPNNCYADEKRGNCTIGGQCKCNPQYLGIDCSLIAASYSYGDGIKNVTTTPGWRFYLASADPQKSDPDSTLIQIYLTNLAFVGSLRNSEYLLDENYRYTESNSLSTSLGAIQTDSMILFVKKGGYPTLVSYDYVIRNLTNKATLSIIVPGGVRNSIYYIGLWGDGLLSLNVTQYLFQSTLSYYCPNDCSGHGTCKQGACNCDSYWSSRSDCSIYIQPVYILPLFSQDDIALRTWKFYTIVGEDVEFPYVSFTLTVVDNPIYEFLRFNLFIKFGSLPTRLSYDVVENCWFDNHTSDMTCIISYNEIPLGSSVNFGIYLESFGGASVEYKFSINNFNQCPNSCNGNMNRCSTFKGECNCPIPYKVLPDCSISEQTVSLSTQFGGTVSAYTWNFYRIDIRNYYNTTFLLSQFTVLANSATINPVDIYFRKSFRPTQLSYDFKVDSNSILNTPVGGTNGIIEQIFYTQNSIIQPATWFIGVYNPQNTTLSYQVDLNNAIPYNSVCNYPLCECPSTDTVGPYCNWRSSNITTDITYNSFLTYTNSWEFFTFNITTQTPLVIFVIENSKASFQSEQIVTYLGVFDVYVKKGGKQFGLPQKTDYDHSSTTNKFINSVSIISNESVGTWMVGVTTRNFTITISTGCQAFKSCSQCLEDSLCGWCISGNDVNPIVTQVPSLTNYLSNYDSKCVNKTNIEHLCPVPWVTNQAECNLPFTEYAVKGRIAGGVIGGLILFFLAVALFLLYIKKKGFIRTRDTVIAAFNAPVSFFPETNWSRSFAIVDDAILSDPETVPILEDPLEIQDNVVDDPDKYQNIFNANFNLINDDESDEGNS